MDIMRGDRNGVELYSLIRTGISGMSISGMGRLSGVKQSTVSRLVAAVENGLDPLMRVPPEKCSKSNPGLTPDLMRVLPGNSNYAIASKQLQPFLGNVPILFDGRDDKNKATGKLKIYRYDFSAAVIRHYAYRGNATAQYSLDQFSDMGVLKWIQDITGWTKPEDELTISQRKKIDP